MRRLPTQVGKALHGDNHFLGLSCRNEWSVLDSSQWQQASRLVGGPPLTSKQVEFLDQVRLVSTAADPRIWPLKLVRVASSYGGFFAGYGVALSAMQGAAIGPCIFSEVGLFLSELGALSVSVSRLSPKARAPENVGQLELPLEPGSRILLPGFGVPARQSDERFEAISQIVEKHRAEGPNWALMLDIVQNVTAKRTVRPNVAMAFCAVLFDLGIPLCGFELFGLLHLGPSILANAHEGSSQAPEILQQLPISAIAYSGPARRLLRRR